jgi:hypothetical protein
MAGSKDEKREGYKFQFLDVEICTRPTTCLRHSALCPFCCANGCTWRQSTRVREVYNPRWFAPSVRAIHFLGGWVPPSEC